MKQFVLSQFDLPWIPLTGLMIFAFSFLFYVLWTFKTEKRYFDEVAKIPLDNEKGENSHE